MTIDLHHLIAPYTLDALEPDERSRFEAHLALCEQCRAELVGFLSTAARLGEVEAATPPPALRERLARDGRDDAAGAPCRHRALPAQPGPPVAPRLALAAAVAVAVVGIGGFVAERERAEDLSADRARVVAVMTAADAHHDRG